MTYPIWVKTSKEEQLNLREKIFHNDAKMNLFRQGYFSLRMHVFFKLDLYSQQIIVGGLT